MVWRIPMVDHMLVVDLNRTLPGWRGLSQREIEKRVIFIVLHYAEIPVGLSLSDLSEAMEREAHENRPRRLAIELAKEGLVDQAIEILAASEPGLGKDIAAVHLRFLTLPGDNTDLQEGLRLARTGQREKALPGLCKALGTDGESARRWLEFFLKERAGS